MSERTDWCMECGAATRKAEDGKSAECPKCGAEFVQVAGPIWGKRRREPTQVEREMEDLREAWRNFNAALMETWPFRTVQRFARSLRWSRRGRTDTSEEDSDV